MAGHCNPYSNCSLCLHPLQEDGEWLPVYKTRVIKNNLNPDWGEVTLRATQLNNGDMLRPLQVQVGRDDVILPGA